MKTLFALLACLFLISPLASGCSGEETPQASSADEIISGFKDNLKVVVDTGEGGSGLDLLRSQYELLQQQAPQKAKAVEQDFQKLMTTSKPDERKSAATKIMNAL